nr:hypothetical protein [Prauserella muralis]
MRQHLAAASRVPITLRAERLEIRETTDPEVIVAECDYDVTVTTTGARLTVRNIFVVRVRDGKIMWSRDYHDPTMLVEALDHPIA